MDKIANTTGALAAARSGSRGPGIKSPVYVWLAARYDHLLPTLTTHAPSWKKLAEYLGNGGVLNADGQLPTPASVRSSWLRVTADIHRTRIRRLSVTGPHGLSFPDASAAVDDNGTGEVPDFSSNVKG